MQPNQHIEANRKRWLKLPAGRWRTNIGFLLKLPDCLFVPLYNYFSKFWEKEREWEYVRYTEIFTNKDVLEIGSGLGYDGIKYAQTAASYTYAELNKIQILFLKKITALFNRTNMSFEFMEDPVSHIFSNRYNAFYAHGVLHHVPFKIAQKQFRQIDRFLEVGSYCVFLMYPKERWEQCGKPSFEKFGKYTDGNCPWTEYYDTEKMKALVGDKYELVFEKKWGNKNEEFVNFEFIKKQA